LASGSGPGEDAGVEDVEIRDESIRLGQLLKLAGLIDNGSDARMVLEGGDVRVNGEPEARRGRQVRPGDVVEALGARVRVVRAG
jgi:ribosome-associated protein